MVTSAGSGSLRDQTVVVGALVRTALARQREAKTTKR